MFEKLATVVASGIGTGDTHWKTNVGKKSFDFESSRLEPLRKLERLAE
jgi:hypothetical protein